MNALFLFVFVFVFEVKCQTNELFDENEGIFAAFGDFDSDKFTDVFVIAENGKALKALKGQKSTPYLSEQKQWSCHVNDSHSIVGVIPGDFDGNALMDVVVVATNDIHGTFALFLLKGNKSKLDCDALRKEPFAVVNNHPLALDINGDMIADLFAEAHNDKERYLWLGQVDGKFKTLKAFNVSGNEIRNPNSNAFIDLDGDLVTDLFVSGKQYLEYWKSPSSSSKEPIWIPYPSNANKNVIGESSFFDINSDGQIDHILPVCGEFTCSLMVWQGTSWETIADVLRSFDNSSSIFVKNREIGKFILPMKLRHADVDGDGYPDLIALMSTTHQQRPSVVILHNVVSETNSLGRTFVPQWNIRPDVTENNHAVIATFFDLKEDGKTDVLMAYRSDEKSNDFKIAYSFNTQMIDACFLKVLVTSGLCYGHCPPEQSSPMDPMSSTIAYGTNQAGPLITFELMNTEGSKRRSAAGQLSQSADFSLQMPYSIFGLGEQPNFVDKLTASIPNGTSKPLHQTWPQIIPDSQVVVIPYPPSDPRQWRTKLFITPSDIVISTLITLTCICFFLILIIAILHRKEVMEDIAEHEEYKRHWPECR